MPDEAVALGDIGGGGSGVRPVRRGSVGAREKNPEFRNHRLATLPVMAAHPKLTAGRETRLLALLTLGEPLEAACRAIRVSSTAVRKRAARDPAFAQRLRAVRERPERDPLAVSDWRVVAAQLESEYPEHWARASAWDESPA